MARLFVRSCRLEATPEEVFRWHASPGALERLTPPWEDVRVLERKGGIDDGGRVVISTPAGPFRARWVAEHHGCIPGAEFRDVQLEGPFARWEHCHRMTPADGGACTLEDRIDYALPSGVLGDVLAGAYVRRKLERLFDYRHRVTAADLAAHALWKEKKSMKILVSGATGLVGSDLVPFLTTGGHTVHRLVRQKMASNPTDVFWDPNAGKLDPAALEGFDAVVHLAGENIAGRRWSAAQKARIRDSRIKGTTLLCQTLARLQNKPKSLVCASAIGFYGDRGDERLTETSPPGTGFVVDVCRDWEAATKPAQDAGLRVVSLRIGVILTPKGGALAKMLLPFKMGGGGVIGSGQQYFSWIALDDIIGAIHHALMADGLKGPVNGVSPNPVTNREFTKTLGKVLHRPTVVPMPAFLARLAFGEMANELLLASTRVEPTQLLATNYKFRFPDLEGALRHLLGKAA